MAYSPRHMDVLTESGVVRVSIRYVRPFRQVVPVEFCWLFKAGIEHACDEFGCWPK
jgi:hypothetical protein